MAEQAGSGIGLEVAADRWREVLSSAYREEIEALERASGSHRSIYIDIIDLYNTAPELTRALLANPDRQLGIADRVLGSMVESVDRTHVRLENHPGLLPIDGLRSRHVDELVAVDGIVTRVKAIETRAKNPVFACPNCDRESPLNSSRSDTDAFRRCSRCGQFVRLELDIDRSDLVDVQDVYVSAEAQSGASTPDFERHVVIEDDIVDTVGPGARVRVTGIVRTAPTERAARRALIIEASSIESEPESQPEEQADLRHIIESVWSSVSD